MTSTSSSSRPLGASKTSETSQIKGPSCKERGVEFWRRCAAEPHCIRLLPENQPRTRNEAILRRAVNPGDLRSYYDHRGRFMYPSRPVAMEMDAIRERRRQNLEVVRRHTEMLKSIVLKQEYKPEMPKMDLGAMRERLAKAKLEHAQTVRRRRRTDELPTAEPNQQQAII